MTDTPETRCLFVGGSADGKHLPVDTGLAEVRIPSMSGQQALQDPIARALDDDPIPDESVVYERYRRVEMEHDGKPITIYALNNLTEDAIVVQFTKHFGSADSAPLP